MGPIVAYGHLVYRATLRYWIFLIGLSIDLYCFGEILVQFNPFFIKLLGPIIADSKQSHEGSHADQTMPVSVHDFAYIDDENPYFTFEFVKHTQLVMPKRKAARNRPPF